LASILAHAEGVGVGIWSAHLADARKTPTRAYALNAFHGYVREMVAVLLDLVGEVAAAVRV
jgi:hypothetical protein